MKTAVTELCDKFRTGSLGRRDFIQGLIATTGSVLAASHALSMLGFDSSLIQEARAQESVIEESTGQYMMSDRSIDFFLAKPTQGGPFPAIIVIHENVGITEFVRNVARKFARRGALALAPHVLPFALLPDGQHAPWMLETLRTGVAAVPEDEIDALNAGFEWLTRRPDVDVAHIASVGFCWGGARSFTLATRNTRLWAAIVFYGSTPPFEALPDVTSPMLALYGALDNNTATSITGRAAETAREMRRLNKVFEWEVYSRAPHGFFRAPDMSVSDSRAAVQAWDTMLEFLGRYWAR